MPVVTMCGYNLYQVILPPLATNWAPRTVFIEHSLGIQTCPMYAGVQCTEGLLLFQLSGWRWMKQWQMFNWAWFTVYVKIWCLVYILRMIVTRDIGTRLQYYVVHTILYHHGYQRLSLKSWVIRKSVKSGVRVLKARKFTLCKYDTVILYCIVLIASSETKGSHTNSLL